ncbi:BamA/TamA family outer membrane protein [Persicobacter diffluens]|uniref:BamA/TamA family outer membrane protein n=1 Tax=Persicobacter diffluens TaxID=981 RepID=UPI0030C68D4D
MSKPLFALFLLFIGFCQGSAHAQHQADSLSSGQEMKLVEDVMDWVTIDKEKYTLSFYPLLDYSERAGLDVGIMPVIVLKDQKERKRETKYSRPTTIIPSFAYSTKGQMMLDTDVIYYHTNGWLLGARILWYQIPDTFYGIGGPNVAPTEFLTNTFGATGVWLNPLTDVFFLGLSYDVSWVDNSRFEGESLDESIRGFEGGFTTGLGLDARFDTRDDILYPSRGQLFTFDYRYYFGDFNFHHLELDLASFWKIGSAKNVIGAQAYYEFVLGDDVPFYKLPQLGGKHHFRAIGHPNRYIDNQIYYVQAEYRRHIYGRFGAAAFGGWGNTHAEWENPFVKNGKWMYGAGLRFQLLPDDHLNFRLDVGKTAGEEMAIFFTMREAF